MISLSTAWKGISVCASGFHVTVPLILYTVLSEPVFPMGWEALEFPLWPSPSLWKALSHSVCSLSSVAQTSSFHPQNYFLHLPLLSLTDPLSFFNSQLRWHFLDNSFSMFPQVCTSPCCSSSHTCWYSLIHKDRGHIAPSSSLYPQAKEGVQWYSAQQ